MRIRYLRWPHRWLPILLLGALLAVPVNSDQCWAAGPPAPTATTASKAPSPENARRAVRLPGLVIDFQQRCVDLEAMICLDKGGLELIACTKGTKEHESIVSVKARPMHILTALLLLGANPGNPAMLKKVEAEETRWVEIPPRGDSIGVSLVFDGEDGRPVELPISDFVTRTEPDTNELSAAVGESADRKFPDTFLFAGSLLRADGPRPRKYLSDVSGHVISIATFGDELLCLPGVHSRDDSWLLWRVDSTNLPGVGAKVTLRLRPQRTGKPESVAADEHKDRDSNDAEKP